jgi:hypothetical protein
MIRVMGFCAWIALEMDSKKVKTKMRIRAF